MISHPIGKVGPLIKVTDFGLRHIRRFDGDHGNRQFRAAHTEGWMCPFDDEDDPSFDLFSLGCLFVFVLIKEHPFGEKMEMRITRIQSRQPMLAVCEVKISEIGYQLLNLIMKMLDFNANQRPKSYQVLEHSYFCPQQVLYHTPESLTSRQSVTPHEPSAMPTTSTPRPPSGEPPAKMKKTEQPPPVHSPFSVSGIYQLGSNLHYPQGPINTFAAHSSQSSIFNPKTFIPSTAPLLIPIGAKSLSSDALNNRNVFPYSSTLGLAESSW